MAGGLEILSQHAPLVAVLKPGKISYDNQSYELKTKAILSVGNNQAKIFIS